MPKPLTADDIISLVACLTPRERARLLRLIGARSVSDANAYEALPPVSDEFSADGEDPLGWDAEGWEESGEEGRDTLVHVPTSGQASPGSGADA